MHWNVHWLSPGISDCRWFWFPFNTTWLFWIFLSIQAFYLVKKTATLIVGRKEGGLEQGWNKGCALGSEWISGLGHQNPKTLWAYHVQMRWAELAERIGWPCGAGAGGHLPGRPLGRAHSRLVWDGTQTPGASSLFLADVQLEHVCRIALKK